jgi:hypothetical protein
VLQQLDVLTTRDKTFAQAEARGEHRFVAGKAHQVNKWPAVQPDLEWLLARNDIAGRVFIALLVTYYVGVCEARKFFLVQPRPP